MKKFLIIIDLQNGFIKKGFNDKTVSRTNDLLERRLFDCVIATIYQNYEGSPISNLMGWHEMQTFPEQQPAGNLLKHANHTVTKTVYSAFSPKLKKIIVSENSSRMPECVFIAGVDTDCCVLATASDFFEAGIRPIVLTHYCGSSGGRQKHRAGIRCLESCIGKNNLFDKPVRSSQALLKAMEKAKRC